MKRSTARGHLVYFRKRDATIDLSKKVNSHSVRDFCAAIEHFKVTQADKVVVDFYRVLHASPGGMLPIICMLDVLRDSGVTVHVRLPRDQQVRSLFDYTRWTDCLMGTMPHGRWGSAVKHSVVRRFDDAAQQRMATDDFMEIIDRNLEVPRSILAGAAWIFQEMTNNVLCHAGSKFGGLAQVSIYPREQVIAFAVADSGKGVLGSMQEGFPRMRADLQAIGEAIKPGISKAPKIRSGYGLARALDITILTGGAFEITSGRGKLMAAAGEELKRKSLEPMYTGTAVCGQLRVNQSFSLSQALDFDAQNRNG